MAKISALAAASSKAGTPPDDVVEMLLYAAERDEVEELSALLHLGYSPDCWIGMSAGGSTNSAGDQQRGHHHRLEL